MDKSSDHLASWAKGKAEARRNDGRLDDAIAQYRQALQIDARFIDAQIALASALFAKGELEEAKARYLEATRPRPEACPAS